MNAEFLKESLLQLEKNNLKRRLRDVMGPQDARIVLDGREVLNFCSNNYLGLANDPRLKEAAMEAIKTQGIGAGASRLVCGNMRAHERLEQKIAKFKNKERALLFNTGYMANVGIISSLFSRSDTVFCDRLNHASIVDGIILSQAKMKRYPHLDMDALEDMIQSSESHGQRAIITDSVFSMDGDTAPLKKIVELAQTYNCIVMIDEAHALGILGDHGRGLAEHLGVEDGIDIQMGTLSKAAGGLGAYVCGSEDLIEYIVNHARSFIYTTALPASMAEALSVAIDIIGGDVELRSRLKHNTFYMKQKLSAMGFDVNQTEVPIIPLIVQESSVALEFSQKLLEQNIFVSAIRPPTVPHNSARLRLTVMATHTQQDLDDCLTAIERTARALCLV
jgi:8-amino-7-oxononanoate synthase